MLSNKIRREMAEEGVEVLASVSLQEALAALFGDDRSVAGGDPRARPARVRRLP